MEPKWNRQFNPLGPGADVYGNGGHDPDLHGPDYQMLEPGMPMPRFASPANVRREAQERTGNIFASYNTLQAIVLRHEGTI